MADSLDKSIDQDEELRRIFAKNLLHYIAKSGVPMQRIADATGISKSALSNYCSGYRYPRPSQLSALAKYLQVSVGDLTDDGEQVAWNGNDRLSRDAASIARDYDQLDPEDKELIRTIMAHLLKRKHV